jgi:hypothetical protein
MSWNGGYTGAEGSFRHDSHLFPLRSSTHPAGRFQHREESPPADIEWSYRSAHLGNASPAGQPSHWELDRTAGVAGRGGLSLPNRLPYGAPPSPSQRQGASMTSPRGGSQILPAMAPPSQTSRMCTRVTVLCAAFLVLLGPALLIAGGVLASASNPRSAEEADFIAAAAAFDAGSADVLLTTSGVTIAESPSRALSPSYQNLVGTPFPSTRTVVLQTLDRAPVMETSGPNQGSVSARITYRQGLDSTVGQTFTFVSPPVALTRPATKPVYCTPAYASICGTSTCCTATEMQRQCVAIVREKSKTSEVNFIPNGADCRLGLNCGECGYWQSVSDLCFVLRWSALNGWSGDTEKGSCVYPFLPTGQGYSDSDAGATLTLRAADDPFIVLQALTEGTLQLDDDGSRVRSQGRGLILFGSLALLLAASIVLLAKFCGRDVLTAAALQRAFNIKPRSKPARLGDGSHQHEQFLESVPPGATWKQSSNKNAPHEPGLFVPHREEWRRGTFDPSHRESNRSYESRRMDEVVDDGDFAIQYFDSRHAQQSPIADFRVSGQRANGRPARSWRDEDLVDNEL